LATSSVQLRYGPFPLLKAGCRVDIHNVVDQSRELETLGKRYLVQTQDTCIRPVLQKTHS